MSRLRPSDLGISHAAAVSGDRAREYERTHDVFGQPIPSTEPDPSPTPARPKTVRIVTPDGAPWTPPAPVRTAAVPPPAARGGRPQPTQSPPAPLSGIGLHVRGGRTPEDGEVVVSREQWNRIRRVVLWADRNYPRSKS
jgi:hypothetical protein